MLGALKGLPYDTTGRILTATNKEIGCTYTYDTAGRMTNVTDNKNNITDYEYDILGTKTRTTLQKGTPDEHVTSYGYYTANRPVTEEASH